MKTATVLFLAIVSQAVGDVLLTRGMKTIVASPDSVGSGSLFDLLRNALKVGVSAASNTDVLIGTICLIVFFTLYSAALSWADLSFVLPATAFGYVLNVAAGHYFLNESVSTVRWAGSVIITLGVVFVSRSSHSTVRATGKAT